MRKVLVIEDNSNNLRLISYVLKRNGYEVISAESGEEGVELVQSNKELPYFIIVDINLPGIDGLEVARRIKKFDFANNIPLVAITSYAMVGDRERILSAGFNGYFEKPIDPLTIMDKIHEIILNK
jgi:CheY-like chemotaxis protein